MEMAMVAVEAAVIPVVAGIEAKKETETTRTNVG